MLVAASAPVLWLPERALAPDQPSDASHEVALVELQLKVAAPFVLTLVGLADRETVGAGGGALLPTWTVTTLVTAPIGPSMQFSVKTLVWESGPTVSLPEVAFWPVQAPNAWQAQ